MCCRSDAGTRRLPSEAKSYTGSCKRPNRLKSNVSPGCPAFAQRTVVLVVPNRLKNIENISPSKLVAGTRRPIGTNRQDTRSELEIFYLP